MTQPWQPPQPPQPGQPWQQPPPGHPWPQVPPPQQSWPQGPPAQPWPQQNPYPPQAHPTQPFPGAPTQPGPQPWPAAPASTPPADITSYAPPKRGGTLMWIVVAAAVLVGVLIAGMLLQSTPLPTAAPTSAAPAPVSQGPGLPFTMPSNASSTGRWEVLSQEWSARGVTLRVRVSCDTGTVTYGFKAFPNSGMDVVDPSPGSRTPALSTGTLHPGETASGYIFLELPRGAATLILTTSAGRQISALPITA